MSKDASTICNICDKEVSIPHHHGRHEYREHSKEKICLDSDCIVELQISNIRKCECCLDQDMTSSDLVICNYCSKHCNDNECLRISNTKRTTCAGEYKINGETISLCHKDYNHSDAHEGRLFWASEVSDRMIKERY